MDTSSESESSDPDYAEHSGYRRVSRIPRQEELLSLLECPVCFELPLPPIWTCVRGHIICDECRPKLSLCPLCQQAIGRGRNFFAEDFVNKSQLCCIYQDDGCERSMAAVELKRHARTCNFRPFKCRFCTRRVRYADIERHLRVQHQVARWDINDGGVKILHLDKYRRNQQHAIIRENWQTMVTWKELLCFLSLVAISIFLEEAMLVRSPELL